MMTRHEFSNSISSPDCMEFWLSKTKEEIRDMLGNDVAKMVGFDQKNPHHCYDLFCHSLHTVLNVQKRLKEEVCIDICLLTAAFFHDIGKTETAKAKSDRLVFYGHATKSSEIAQPILSQLGFTSSEIRTVCFYIAHHDSFISFVLPNDQYHRKNRYMVEITQANVLIHKRRIEAISVLDSTQKWEHLWRNLIILCYADALSQSDIVYSGGHVIDTRKHKLQKLKVIASFLINNS